jgi:hypothetical protein|nr:MAG TPA: hypothetical protein [Caudoviricetes sp.]
MNYFKCESIRLCRYLYSLGFEKESRFDENKKEYWIFKKTTDLQKALGFFFYMRKKKKENM